MIRRKYKFDLFAYLRMCESNYDRLEELLLDLDSGSFGDSLITFEDETKDVHITVEKLGRYTSTVTIRQGSPAIIPELIIRADVYHDVHATQVKSFQNQHRFRVIYDYPNPQMRHPDEKAQVNRFLGEFLGQCLKYGVCQRIDLQEAGAPYKTG